MACSGRVGFSKKDREELDLEDKKREGTVNEGRTGMNWKGNAH